VAALRALVDQRWLDRIFLPYRHLLCAGRFIRGRAVSVDGRRVRLASGEFLQPDYLVLATGSGYPLPGKTGAARYRPRGGVLPCRPPRRGERGAGADPGRRPALTLITPQGRQVARAAADAEGGYSLVAGTVAAAGNCFPAAGLTDAQGMVVHAYGDIGLAAGTRLSGVVVTIDGTRPVPGAQITLLDDTGAVAAAADTDPAGRHMIENLADGEYTAIISGYPPTASALHITRRAGPVRHDIWLGPAWADDTPFHRSAGQLTKRIGMAGRHHGIWGLAPDHSRASAYPSACGATACALTGQIVQSCADSAGHSRGAQCRHRYSSPRLCTRYAARTAGPHRSHVSFIWRLPSDRRSRVLDASSIIWIGSPG
jgi:hypothetical protein